LTPAAVRPVEIALMGAAAAAGVPNVAGTLAM
jgi:hypothetical protein